MSPLGFSREESGGRRVRGQYVGVFVCVLDGYRVINQILAMCGSKRSRIPVRLSLKLSSIGNWRI